MSVRQIRSTTRDVELRGVEVGAAARDLIHANLAGYQRLFGAVGVPEENLPGYGEQACAAIESWAPDLARELTGLAKGADVEAWQLGMLNARTEILATVGPLGEGECSTAVRLVPGAAPRTIQTWDWHDELDSAKTLVETPGPDGRTVKYFTEAGLLGKIGVSDAGVGVHFNILNHETDGATIGTPVHVVARRILDSATGIGDAVEIARSARVSASTVVTVVTYQDGVGRAVCVELSPAGVAVVEPDEHGYLTHTNHFLAPELARGDLACPTDSTFARDQTLHSRGAVLASGDFRVLADALCVHEPPICCHARPELPFHERWRSLLTIGLDLHAGNLLASEGGPCSVGDDWLTF